jgi:hypothetical protein
VIDDAGSSITGSGAVTSAMLPTGHIPYPGAGRRPTW